MLGYGPGLITMCSALMQSMIFQRLARTISPGLRPEEGAAKGVPGKMERTEQLLVPFFLLLLPHAISVHKLGNLCGWVSFWLPFAERGSEIHSEIALPIDADTHVKNWDQVDLSQSGTNWVSPATSGSGGGGIWRNFFVPKLQNLELRPTFHAMELGQFQRSILSNPSQGA